MYHPSLYNIPDDTALRIAQLIQDSKSGSEAVNSKAQALYVQKKEAPRDGFSRSFFILNLGQENYVKSSCPSTTGFQIRQRGGLFNGPSPICAKKEAPRDGFSRSFFYLQFEARKLC